MQLISVTAILFPFGHQSDFIDTGAQFLFLLVVILIPVLGYWLKILDIRAYYRAIRGVLVKVTAAFSGDEIPDWVKKETPPCIQALGLDWPCTEIQIKESYRKLAEKNHPDLGGDRQRFLYLQGHFEQAIRFVRENQ